MGDNEGMEQTPDYQEAKDAYRASDERCKEIAETIAFACIGGHPQHDSDLEAYRTARVDRDVRWRDWIRADWDFSG